MWEISFLMGILTSTAVECGAKLEKFLGRWHAEDIAALELAHYTEVGNNDTLCYWLEYGSEELGIISGQTSMSKYGIWQRKDDKEGVSPAYKDDGVYKWAVKYGDDPIAVFGKIKKHLNEIVACARSGDFELIDNIDLHSFAKWKLAFIFSQDRLLPIYNSKILRWIACHFELHDYGTAPMSKLHKHILSFKDPDENIFDFAVKYYWMAKNQPDRNYYLIGSKYEDGNSKDTVDVFPDMIEKSAVSTGFFWDHDFSDLVGKDHSQIDKAIRKRISAATDKFDASLRTFKHFLNLKKGDIVAVKSHGRFNKLTIIGYAEVKEVDGKVYQSGDDDLGHLINVEFLETNIAIKTGLTYAETIHKITPGERQGHFEAIFGSYAVTRTDDGFLEEQVYLEEGDSFDDDEIGDSDIRDKDTSTFARTIASTTQVVKQIHNTIQNEYARYLQSTFPGEEIKTERSRIDIWRKNTTGFYIYEVKPYNTAYACIREALGQLTDYAFSKASSKPTYLTVVGTAKPTPREEKYIRFLGDNLGLKFSYECFSLSEKTSVSYP